MKIGKLYKIEKYFWLLFPSKEIATAAAGGRAVCATTHALNAVADAAFWSEQLNCNVPYISPNGIFCLLEQAGKYLKVLTTTGELGWMVHPENEGWTKGTIEEVKQ